MQAKLRVSLNDQERGVYAALLSQADPSGDNRIEGAAAVPFFKKSGLPVEILRQVWSIATSSGEGFLNKERFYIALRLIGHAQAGKPLSDQLIINNEPAPLPQFVLGRQPEKIQWEITAEEMQEYRADFHRESHGKGYLTADEAFVILKRSGLPKDDLAQIWDLADPNETGNLVLEQYAVAMHLIRAQSRFLEHSGMSHRNLIPEQLPPELQQVLNSARLQLSVSQMPIQQSMPPQQGIFDFGMPSGPSMQLENPALQPTLPINPTQPEDPFGALIPTNPSPQKAPIPAKPIDPPHKPPVAAKPIDHEPVSLQNDTQLTQIDQEIAGCLRQLQERQQVLNRERERNHELNARLNSLLKKLSSVQPDVNVIRKFYENPAGSQQQALFNIFGKIWRHSKVFSW